MLQNRLADEIRKQQGRGWQNFPLAAPNAAHRFGDLGLLINDLLAHNQLEAANLHLDRESHNLCVVIMDALSTVFPLLREKGQQLDDDLPQPLPTLVDAQQLKHVLVNLLNNAHHHTPLGRTA